jgi:tRNA pseudouridine55 synthase
MDGILNIYKEKGFTSHDVVAKLRGILHQKKIGHTGTLDPDAVGVLPVCLGKATKVCDLLTQKDKVYEAEMLLGTVTDTQDITGTVLSRKETEGLTREMVLEAVTSFVGEYDQVPPMYSALKVQGKKLYELARAGIEVEREPRRVQIFGMDDIEICLEEKTVRFRVSCSKGTYIRTLCQDIGEKLGCGACMKSLKRTRVSVFPIEEAHTLAQIEQMVQEDTINEVLIAVDSMFPDYPKVIIKDVDKEKLLLNGNPLKLPKQGEKLRLYHIDGHFAAIYEWRENAGMYFPEKMF